MKRLVLLFLTLSLSLFSETATFAGGCFWCMEPPFEGVRGVESVVVGYTGGSVAHPTYSQVSSGSTGHVEAVQITYDPQKISYEKLLDIYWHNVDPTQKDGQFCDIGNQYRTVIFYHNEQQKQLAEKSKAELMQSGIKPIYTEILPAKAFYPAEDYHQGYHKKNPVRYKFYRYNCGRDKQLKKIWG